MRSLDSEEIYFTEKYRRAFETVANFVKDFSDGLKIGRSISLNVESVEKVIFMGVGGSGIISDVAAQLLSSMGIETKILKNYNLPNGKWDLAIAISHSGNTAETIKAVLDLIDKNMPCVFITSGGILSEIAAKREIPVAKVNGRVPPRYCFPNMFGAILGLFEKMGLMQVEVDLEELRRFQEKLMEKSPTNSNPAKQAALKIVKSNPLVYVYEETKSIGYRLKCQLSENAKIRCGFGEVPEVLHNEVEVIGPGDLIILPRISGESQEMKEAVDTLIWFFGDDRCLCLRADSKGKLNELLELFMLVDYISLYASILKNADPIDIPRITELRRINKINEEILRRVRAMI